MVGAGQGNRPAHILPALVFLVLAPLQFSRRFRERHLRWHRLNGRVVLGCGTVTGVTALLMSVGMPAIGGVNQAAATILFALFFLFALGKAFRHIRRHEIASHREWMMRAFQLVSQSQLSGLSSDSSSPQAGLPG
jgi:uncharacterized membrane protein